MRRGIIERYENNPILTPEDIPYPVATVHNAGVARHAGRYLMLFRSHLFNGRSILGLAESADGFRFTPRPEPFLAPAPGARAPCRRSRSRARNPAAGTVLHAPRR